MTVIYRLEKQNITTRRLDPWHYQPKFLETIRQMEDSTGCLPLGELIDPNRGIAGGATPLGANYLDEGRVRFYRTSEIDNLFLNSNQAVFITDEDDEKLKRSRLHVGDVLLTITGAKFGKSAVVKDDHLPGNISQHSVRFHPNGNLDPYFLVAYLDGVIGQTVIWREAYGATRPAIDFPSVSALAIPVVAPRAQAYIGDKVRQAERLRQRARELYDFSLLLMELLVEEQVVEQDFQNMHSIQQKIHLWQQVNGLIPEVRERRQSAQSKATSNTVTPEKIEIIRMDAEYYQELYVESVKKIEHVSFGAKRLGDLVDALKDGPGGWGVSTNDYKSSGVPVLRTVNIINGSVDLEDCVFISEEKHQELIAHEVKYGDVVLSVRGSAGRAAVFHVENVPKASMNAAVARMRCKAEILPYYLTTFFNCTYGQIQSERIANGAVQKNMNLTETKSHWIPLPDLETQKFIAYQAAKAEQLFRLSKSLVSASKLLVESLITGDLSGDELGDAFDALQQGNRELDRAILARMTSHGIDVVDAPRLFPDIDALYGTLDGLGKEPQENEVGHA